MMNQRPPLVQAVGLPAWCPRGRCGRSGAALAARHRRSSGRWKRAPSLRCGGAL